MTQPIKAKGEKVYNTYTFSGVWQWKSKGQELKAMSLKECFQTVFSTSYDNDMKQFFETRNFHFDMREMSLEDIRENVEKGFVFFPFSSTVRKNEVMQYMDAGFNVLFMRAKDFNAMKKEYIK